MAEYIVRVDEERKVGDPNIDPLAYLYSLPVLEEIIRCRDCDYVNDDPCCTHPRWRRGQSGVIVYPSVDLDGFCAWAERDE